MNKLYVARDKDGTWQHGKEQIIVANVEEWDSWGFELSNEQLEFLFPHIKPGQQWLLEGVSAQNYWSHYDRPDEFRASITISPFRIWYLIDTLPSVCSKCGQPLPEKKYCPECGQEMPETITPED